MKTIIADDRRRVLLPDAKPRQVYAYEEAGGVMTLTPVKKVEVKERFPRGSLVKYVEEMNREFAPIARKMKIPPPPKEWE